MAASQTQAVSAASSSPAAGATLDAAAAKVAGELLFLAACVILMGIITAEAHYPAGYSTADSEISDLGATRPPDSVSHQPSAAIFNTTMLVSGAMIGVAAFLLHRALGRKAVSIPTALLAIGVFGVGVFPGNYSAIHPILAMLAFVSGGLAAVLSYRVVVAPFRVIVAALGVISLLSLALNGALDAVVGVGGIERWIAYPVVLWLAGFGGYLMSTGALVGPPRA
jgi:hypothetical membrane protein